MKYFNLETVTGDLILIRANRPTLPACPVLAKRAKASQSAWLTVILVICGLFKPLVAVFWAPTRQRLATVMFLVSIMAMLIAESYLDKMLLVAQ